MSNSVSNAGIEDVLSSIRRLVSEDGNDSPAAAKVSAPEEKAPKPAAQEAERFVLTPALRVAELPLNEAEPESDQEAKQEYDQEVDGPDLQSASESETEDVTKLNAEEAYEDSAEQEIAEWQDSAPIQEDFDDEEVDEDSGEDPEGDQRYGEFHQERAEDDNAEDEDTESDHAAEDDGAVSLDTADFHEDYEGDVDEDFIPSFVPEPEDYLEDLEAALNPSQGDVVDLEEYATGKSDGLATATSETEGDNVEDAVEAVWEATSEAVHEEIAEIAASEAVFGEIASDDLVIDEENLREMVADIVRQELQGALGERITRNVRKLVRREIHRALAAHDLD